MNTNKNAIISAFAALAAACLLGSGARAAEPAKDAPVAEAPPAAATAAPTIEALMSEIKLAKKPLPAWAVQIALQAYKTWKTYRNGQKVEALQTDVINVLKVVKDIKEQVEQGREMTEREYYLTRELLDAHAKRLSGLDDRVAKVERNAAHQAAVVKGWAARLDRMRAQSRVCKLGQPGHVWDHSKNACVPLKAKLPTLD